MEIGGILNLLPEKLLEFVLVYQINFIKMNSTGNQGQPGLADRMVRTSSATLLEQGV